MYTDYQNENSMVLPGYGPDWEHGFRDETKTYYHTCPRCGANLDPGEGCDCEEEDAYGQ